MDAAHWLAELCRERPDFEGMRRVVEKGCALTTLDQALNCQLLDAALSLKGGERPPRHFRRHLPGLRPALLARRSRRPCRSRGCGPTTGS